MEKSYEKLDNNEGKEPQGENTKENEAQNKGTSVNICINNGQKIKSDVKNNDYYADFNSYEHTIFSNFCIMQSKPFDNGIKCNKIN